MFLFFAWLRIFAPTVFLLSTVVHAKEASLFTSSVTYCAPPENLLVQQFDVEYIAHNSTVFFNISAASVEANVNVTANLLVNIYGMQPLNLNVSLCSLLNGALCPLPQYNFTGVDWLPLPSSLGVQQHIPGIAFHIPDLEAFAQLTLVEVETGEVKACVQATLSNGWSMHQLAVEWVTGAFALIVLLSAACFLLPEPLASYRLWELMYLFQSVAISALLNLDYPSVYSAFALNFSWSLGLFTTCPPSIQNAINRLRHATGGKLPDSGGSAIDFVNRKLSPYNQLPPRSLVSRSMEQLGGHIARGVVTVTPASPDVLQGGVPIYVNSVGSAVANAFMTVFISCLILAAITITSFALIFALVQLANRLGRFDRLAQFKHSFPLFVRRWTLLLVIIAFPPVTIFTLYQWTLKDSWLTTLFSALMILVIIATIAYPTFILIRSARQSQSSSLYTTPILLGSYGPLYAAYRTSRYFVFITFLTATILKAIFVAFAQRHGELQAISFLVIECGVLGTVLVLRPHHTRGADVLSSFLAIVRVFVAGLSIAFVEKLNVKAIPRVVFGLIIAIIVAVAIVVMFVNLILRSYQAFRNPHAPQWAVQRVESDVAGMLEKGDSFSADDDHRPRNPTPEHNIPLDSHLNVPYPATPTATFNTASLYSLTSASVTTYGQPLSDRWSQSQSHNSSHPNSPTLPPPSPHQPVIPEEL